MMRIKCRRKKKTETSSEEERVEAEVETLAMLKGRTETESADSGAPQLEAEAVLQMPNVIMKNTAWSKITLSMS